MQQAIHRLTSFFVLLTLCGHFFCCVLPLVLSISTLGTSMGLFAVNNPFVAWFVHYETDIFIVAGILIVISGLAQYISARIDCHDTGCEHETCAPKKAWASKVYTFALVLYLVNLSVFLILPDTHVH